MSQPMADAARSAASVLFNLPEYDVVEVICDEGGGRRGESGNWVASQFGVSWPTVQRQATAAALALATARSQRPRLVAQLGIAVVNGSHR